MTMKNPLAAALALIPCVLLAPSASGAVTAHQLSNGIVSASVAEDAGGRLMEFSLVGKPNMLRAHPAAAAWLTAPVDAKTGHVPFNGHEIWVGPQSQWWRDQEVNPARYAQKATWPPDPYLSLATYTVREKDAHSIVLDSPASPVSGLALSKRYSLLPDKPHSMLLDVTARNTRTRPVARDIWFNTRTPSDTRVYVPVASKADIRVNKVQGMHGAPLRYTLAGGIFSLDMVAPPAGHTARQGKILLQPSTGWMAGFHSGQAFIVQFELQPQSAIHPEQGQIELFNDYQPADLSKGLLEMELHAPFVTLQPGQSMQAREQWTMLPYQGPATRKAHLAFLREHAAKLGLVLR